MAWRYGRYGLREALPLLTLNRGSRPSRIAYRHSPALLAQVCWLQSGGARLPGPTQEEVFRQLRGPTHATNSDRTALAHGQRLGAIVGRVRIDMSDWR